LLLASLVRVSEATAGYMLNSGCNSINSDFFNIDLDIFIYKIDMGITR
jgi:hypothetical protein